QPSRGRPRTAGRRAALTFRSFVRLAGASTSGVMSFTTRERSRSTPSPSMSPGFSAPALPKRTSFMSASFSRSEEFSRGSQSAARAHRSGERRHHALLAQLEALALIAQDRSIGDDPFHDHLALDQLALDVFLIVDEDEPLSGDVGIDQELQGDLRHPF